MKCQLTQNNLVNNTWAAMGSWMERPIGRKAAKTAAVMKDIDIDIDPDEYVSSMKVSNESWKGSEWVAAVVEKKTAYCWKRWTHTISWNFTVCMIRKEW